MSNAAAVVKQDLDAAVGQVREMCASMGVPLQVFDLRQGTEWAGARVHSDDLEARIVLSTLNRK